MGHPFNYDLAKERFQSNKGTGSGDSETSEHSVVLMDPPVSRLALLFVNEAAAYKASQQYDVCMHLS